MWKKSLSNKIARIFEVVGYVLLIPTIPLMLISLIFFVSLVVSIPLFALGFTLFVGYVKHSRGNLDENTIAPLWGGTFLFNFIPLIILTVQYCSNPAETLKDLNLFSIGLIFWWILAYCLSLTAVYDEFKFECLRNSVG